MLSLIESYDAVAFTAVLDERLTAAIARLAKVKGRSEEKAWLESAAARLALGRSAQLELLQNAARLPELEIVRSAQIASLQNVAIDAIERLQAGITFHAGSRMPLLDSLFGKLKLGALRRAEVAEFEKFCTDFEKRLGTAYARRLLVTPAFEFATPVVEQVHAAFAGWRAGVSPQPLPEAEAAAVGQALREAAAQLELQQRQVRLLAEAALAPIAGAFEESGLGAKPKKRALKAAAKVEEIVPEPEPVAPPPAPMKKVKKPRAAAAAKASAFNQGLSSTT